MARRGLRCDKHAKRGSRASRPQDLTRPFFFSEVALASRSTDKVINGRSNPEVVGSISAEVKRILSLPRVVL